MKEGKPYKQVLSRTICSLPESSKVYRAAQPGWDDNRPSSILQARLIDGMQRKKEQTVFHVNNSSNGIQKRKDSVIQAFPYLRGLKKRSVAVDKEWLGRTALNPQDELLFKRHYPGLLASLTRYNEGQHFYFSPVGYIVEITEDEKVFGNFARDGNTGDLQSNHLLYEYELTGETRDQLIQYIQANSGPKREDESDAAYSMRVKNVRKRELVLRIRQYKESDAAGKAHLMREMLAIYYTIPDVVQHPLGPGMEPAGLREAEAVTRGATAADLKYTETKAGITPSDLTGAYYNDNQEDRYDWTKVGGSHKENAQQVKAEYDLPTIYKIDGDGKLVVDPLS